MERNLHKPIHLIFLFFVFVSFSFWLLQVLNDDYESDRDIPVVKTATQETEDLFLRKNDYI